MRYLGTRAEIESYFTNKVYSRNNYGLYAICASILAYGNNRTTSKHSAIRVADQLSELSELNCVNGHVNNLVDTLYGMIQKTRKKSVKTDGTFGETKEVEPCAWIVGHVHKVYHSADSAAKAKLDAYWASEKQSPEKLMEVLASIQCAARATGSSHGNGRADVYRARTSITSGHSATRQRPGKFKGFD